MNKIFSIVFGLCAIGEFIGVLTGRYWCLILAIPMALFSIYLWKHSKKLKFN